jgi:hypothetical protein
MQNYHEAIQGTLLNPAAIRENPEFEAAKITAELANM